jgi:hypothetical protein
VLVFAVDPAVIGDGGRTNAAIMQSLQDASPTRAGWPCFGSAGDGVNASGVPVTWAPGQGVVNYPAGMGVPLPSADKLVIQVHYNLADAGSVGRTDQTTVHLQFADSVNRQIVSLRQACGRRERAVFSGLTGVTVADGAGVRPQRGGSGGGGGGGGLAPWAIRATVSL